MKPVNSLFAAAAFSLAALGATAAQAQSIEVLNEGFGNVSGLSGWVQVNNSVPPGSAWFQGNPGIFPAYAGPDDSYAAVSFLSATNGSGSVDNWLITPELSLNGATVLSFYTRHAADAGFDDRLEVLFSPGAGTDASGFSVLTTIGRPNEYTAEWELYNLNVDAGGTGRFAFHYFGDAANLNYVGLDSVSVVTAVPEPSTWAMLGAGLGLFGLRRRKFHA